MIVLIREEKRIYSLVEISDELRDALIDKGVEFKSYNNSKKMERMSLNAIIEDKLPHIKPISSRVMTPGTINDKTPALAIDRGEYGEIYIYLTNLSTEQMFFAFDNADGECIGSLTNMTSYIKEQGFKKKKSLLLT